MIVPLMTSLFAALPVKPELANIASFHLQLEDIHPFNNANGRRRRLWHRDSREHYYGALRMA
jgi:Fic family protein